MILYALLMFFSEAYADYSDGKIVISHDYRITGGAAGSIVPGAAISSDLYKIDIGYNVRTKYIYEEVFWDREIYLTSMYNENNIAGGGGFRLRGGYCFTEDFRIFLGAGLATYAGGGNIENLASTWLYGTLEGGIEYKQFILGVDHASSPFHDSADDDLGINLIYFGFKF
jgi:hypothetical protein